MSFLCIHVSIHSLYYTGMETELSLILKNLCAIFALATKYNKCFMYRCVHRSTVGYVGYNFVYKSVCLFSRFFVMACDNQKGESQR